MSKRYDLIDLRLFVAVADAGNVSRGGAACFLAPSSASLRIKQLEQTLGTQLFKREARGISLTSAGEVMVQHARRCLAELEQMHADLAPYASGIKAHVTLFASTTAIESFLPHDLQAFLRDYPEIRIDMSERISQETLVAVATGQADVGIVTWAGSHAGLDFRPYRQSALLAVMPETDGPAGGHAIDFSNLLDYPFVCPHSGSAIYTFMVSRANRLGRRLDVRIQVTSFASMLSMIRAGVGVGLVPQPVLQLLNCEGVRILPLSDDWATRPLRVCTRGNEPPTAYVRTLLDYLNTARMQPFDPMKIRELHAGRHEPIEKS